MSYKLSIVIPVYNSEESLELLCEKIKKELLDLEYELVFVDDASVDNSWGTLKRIKESCSLNIKAIQLENNVGQHRATLIGFKYCSGETIITLDDDLQHALSDVKKLLENHINGEKDITYGVYLANKKHTFFRNLASAYIKLTSAFFSTHKNSKGSSFRVLTKQITQKLIKHIDEFVYIEEVVQTYTQNINFVEITHLKRKEGKSSYTLLKLLSLYSNILTTYYLKRMKKSLFIIVPIIILLVFFSKTILTSYSIHWLVSWSLFLLGLLPMLLYYLFWISLFMYCLTFNKPKLNTTIIPYKVRISL